MVARTNRAGGGVLRIDFPGFTGQGTLKPGSWDEWFRVFDERRLAFLCQDRTEDGRISRFFKLVDRSKTRRD